MRYAGCIVFCAFTLAGFAQDQLTPSGQTAPEPAITSPSATKPGISYDEAAKQLTAVFPIELKQFDQVIQNSFNWSGPQDASVACEIGFTPQAIVVAGTVLDEHPFIQSRLRPAMADWWRINYGADGLEFSMDDPTSAANSLRFFLNWGAGGLSPIVEVIAAPSGGKKGPLEGAKVELLPLENAEAGQLSAGFRFRAILPTDQLLEPRFFSGPLLIRLRLHDVDGPGMQTYLRMEEVLEKPQ